MSRAAPEALPGDSGDPRRGRRRNTPGPWPATGPRTAARQSTSRSVQPHRLTLRPSTAPRFHHAYAGSTRRLQRPGPAGVRSARPPRASSAMRRPAALEPVHGPRLLTSAKWLDATLISRAKQLSHPFRIRRRCCAAGSLVHCAFKNSSGTRASASRVSSMTTGTRNAASSAKSINRRVASFHSRRK